MNVRPFRLYGRGELDMLRTRIDDALRNWSRQWFDADLSFNSRVCNAAEAGSSGLSWHRATLNQEHLHYAASLHFARHLAQQQGWSGGSKAASASWESAVAEAVATVPVHVLKYHDIDVHLLDISQIASQTSPAQWAPEWEVFGSGVVIYEASFGGETLSLALAADAAEKLLAQKREEADKIALSERDSCIDQGRLHIEVVAGEAEISVSDLVQLGAGQVIVLDTAAGAPLKVRRAEDGRDMGKAYLAVNAGCKAIQLSGGTA
jgi:flagellar motor switch/type III secretory pathway protein FliN